MQKWRIETKNNYSLLNCTPLLFFMKLFKFFTCQTLESKRLKKFLIHKGFSIYEVLRAFVGESKTLFAVCNAKLHVAPLSWLVSPYIW